MNKNIPLILLSMQILVFDCRLYHGSMNMLHFVVYMIFLSLKWIELDIHLIWICLIMVGNNLLIAWRGFDLAKKKRELNIILTFTLWLMGLLLWMYHRDAMKTSVQYEINHNPMISAASNVRHANDINVKRLCLSTIQSIKKWLLFVPKTRLIF